MDWLTTTYNPSGWICLGVIGICAIATGLIGFIVGLSAQEWRKHWRRNILYAWLFIISTAGTIYDFQYSFKYATIEHTFTVNQLPKLDYNLWFIDKEQDRIITVESVIPAIDIPPAKR